MQTDRADRPDSRHSWVVVGIGAVAMIFTFGTALSYGIFRDPFSETFGLPPVALSGVFGALQCAADAVRLRARDRSARSLAVRS